MGTLNETTAKKIAKLFRLTYDAASYDGESLSAVAAMRRLLANEGLSANDIALVIESCNGEIEERKYSDADAEQIYARGVEQGRAQQQHKQQLPPEFYDAAGNPQWNAIALFCQSKTDRLRNDWEKTFVADMAGTTILREPTEKQAKHLIAIFVRLGGVYDPKQTTI
jgi:hypothetical protein